MTSTCTPVSVVWTWVTAASSWACAAVGSDSRPAIAERGAQPGQPAHQNRSGAKISGSTCTLL